MKKGLLIVVAVASIALVGTIESHAQGYDLVVGPGHGPGNENRVRVFTHDGAPAPVDFLAYMAGQWGTNVAAGHIVMGPTDTIVTGPGPGAVYGPQFRGFDVAGKPIPSINGYAYSTLRFGVNVATAQPDWQDWGEIVTGAGPGAIFGPHVRAFDWNFGQLQADVNINFFAFATPAYGVEVGAGDVDGDQLDELLAASGPGPRFGPSVRGFNADGRPAVAIPSINFFALPTMGYGANVAAGDLDGDLRAEILASPGPGPVHAALFNAFAYDGSVSALQGGSATIFTTLYGGRVSAGLLNPPTLTTESLVASPGPDPSAAGAVVWMPYVGKQLDNGAGASFTAYGSTYGAAPAVGYLGY